MMNGSKKTPMSKKKPYKKPTGNKTPVKRSMK